MNTLDQGSFAITLFSLQDGRTAEDYRRFAIEYIRPNMMKMDAVLGFIDHEVVGSIGGTDGWNFVEIIHISSPEEFARDNDAPAGAVVAAAWNEWVKDFRVLFTRDIAAL